MFPLKLTPYIQVLTVAGDFGGIDFSKLGGMGGMGGDEEGDELEGDEDEEMPALEDEQAAAPAEKA